MDYRRGKTVRLKTTTVDEDGTAATPDTSMVINVYNPSGVALVTAGTMTEDSTGSHHYDYTLASDADYGLYRWQAVGTHGSAVSDGINSFEVQEFP